MNEKPPDGLDVPGPLDDHLLNLKQKYATLESKMQTEKENMEERIFSLETDLEESIRMRNSLENEVASQAELIEEQRLKLEELVADDKTHITELKNKIDLGKTEMLHLRDEMNAFREKLQNARVEREDKFKELEERAIVAERERRNAEERQRQLEAEKAQNFVEFTEMNEKLQHAFEEEDKRKAELKKTIDLNGDLDLELRQVTAQRDHARASILKLEEDYKSVAEEAVKHDKEAKKFKSELLAIQTEIASNKANREQVCHKLAETEAKLARMIVERDMAAADLKKVTDEMDIKEHEMTTMRHEHRMWNEEKDEHTVYMAQEKAKHIDIDTENAILRNKIDNLETKLADRKEQLTHIKDERSKFQKENARLESELKNATERLAVASELQNIDMDAFGAMKKTNEDVAKKIELFLTATKNERARQSDYAEKKKQSLEGNNESDDFGDDLVSP